MFVCFVVYLFVWSCLRGRCAPVRMLRSYNLFVCLLSCLFVCLVMLVRQMCASEDVEVTIVICLFVCLFVWLCWLLSCYLVWVAFWFVCLFVCAQLRMLGSQQISDLTSMLPVMSKSNVKFFQVQTSALKIRDDSTKKNCCSSSSRRSSIRWLKKLLQIRCIYIKRNSHSQKDSFDLFISTKAHILWMKSF